MWWNRFTKIQTETTQGRAYQAGDATILEPYPGSEKAKPAIRSEWDTKYS